MDAWVNFTDIHRSLSGQTVFISGGSRGIGEAIALRCARDGANVVIAAKTAQPHPKLPGTIYTVAEKGKWSNFVLILLKPTFSTAQGALMINQHDSTIGPKIS